MIKCQKRQEKILKLLELRRRVQTDELVEYLDSSESTVRRDLIKMQKEGLIVRTFGGVQLSVEKSLVAKTFDEKSRLMRKEKDLIGKKAADLIEPGMTLTLVGGTTLWSTFEIIKGKTPLTIFTNSISVIEQLGSIEGMSIHCSGGRFRSKDLYFIGTETAEMFSKVRADIALLGTDSYIPGIGAFAHDEEMASTERAMARCADKRVFVLDHTKITNEGCYKILDASGINCMITDSGIDDEIKTKLEREPFELIIVETQ